MPQFVATCAKGLEYLLVDELKAIGAESASEGLSLVTFDADWECAYKCLMWSRIASRILYPISSFEVSEEDDLYKQCSIIDWEQHISPGATFLVNAQSYKSKLSHTQYISQLVKDAVVDTFKDSGEERPNVSFERPDIVVHIRLRKNKATLSIDLAGEGLHKRGYRVQGGGAPIKENLAAALLFRAGWDQGSQHLVDPMCGSGTFLIEAAMIALNIAPGIAREYLGLFGWRQFDRNLWQKIETEAKQLRENSLKSQRASELKIVGSDVNPRAIRNAQANIALADLEEVIDTQIAGIDQQSQFEYSTDGLIIVNPPYSERLGERKQVKSLYAQLGDWMKKRMLGWSAAVLSPDKEFGHSLGIRAKKIYRFSNGSIPCELLLLELAEKHFLEQVRDDQVDVDYRKKLSEQAIQLANRLEKNVAKLKRFLQKENVTAYRVYDADLPEYNAAIDIYEGNIHIQEYRAPKSIDAKTAEKRLRDIQTVAAGVMQIPKNKVFTKQRQQQKGSWQYAKSTDDRQQNNFFLITENGRKFWVNLVDYLDTGLFLDHRKTRQLFADKATGKNVLNLFCYTASASVYAATAGAKSTYSVDMSNTYLDWAKRNFKANRIKMTSHTFEREDCLQWLEQALERNLRFDLIFLDPPTFSN
ncbi:MAG: bifunctional 23S rRNA (guanine(2069)-N(7))-methyltransferase RlmK/23S rRNA (guanine(2445)-N(2))-methyltransferase RlmL, partial [Kangiellaceae bacterium]|nr:bifunctional 23S rRNA (guanine(2069)-N(7))-methyltransferase RlmK/23S rRNA (guanine(2445)-N(2))-methyltransferase RlmL [Kangiellaceae bacterium]